MNIATSADGTPIAYERSGSGPPVVLVHGSLNDHNAWAAVTPTLAGKFTVYAVDRRGRGDSGQAAAHELVREFEDVAAVIQAAGEPVDLVGHSFGAHCVLGAAPIAPYPVKHLILYEPPTIEQARATLDEFAGVDPSVAIARFFERILEVPADQVDAMKASPFWAYFLSHVPSLPHEMHALIDAQIEPAHVATLSMPTLLVTGSETQERLGAHLRELATHLPHAEWLVLEGQGHAAMRTAPRLLVDAVVSFLSR